MTKLELTLLREYITNLEYDSEKYKLSKEEISLLKDKIKLLISETNNYLKIIKISKETISSQTNTINSLENDIKKEKKKSYSRGFKTGFCAGGVATIILCLLIL